MNRDCVVVTRRGAWELVSEGKAHRSIDWLLGFVGGQA